MSIARIYGDEINKMLELFPVVVLTGARQTGKTTLLQQFLPDYHYVSLDLPSVAAQAEDDPELFFQKNPPPLIIDEVQYAPGLFRHLKARIDADRHAMGRYVLTGSQKFVLMKALSESLAGRACIMELEGLSFQEQRSAFEISLERFIFRGGFPELSRLPQLPEEAFFSSYVATYLERDIRQIVNVGSLRDFERFVRFLAVRNAQQLDMAAAGRAVGITAKTAAVWLSVLEASSQIHLLEPWLGNWSKRIVKTPKLYFSDSGLVCWLLGLEPRQVWESPFTGSLWETVLFAEMRRVTQSMGLNRKFFYYRDNQGLEVDFLVLGAGCRFGEAKWSSGAVWDDVKNLEKLASVARQEQNAELQDAKLFLLNRSNNRFTLSKDDWRCHVMGIGDVPEFLKGQIDT